MGKLKQILLEQEKNGKNKKNGKNGKMLDGLHTLDDQIEDFIDSLEDKINAVDDNPVFVKKAHQLLADMSKEYSEFIMALRAIVNAVDRKGQVLPSVEKVDSKVRDVNSGAGEEEPPLPEEEEEAPEEEEEETEEFVIAKKKDTKKKDKKDTKKKDKKKKKKGIKEALEG